MSDLEYAELSHGESEETRDGVRITQTWKCKIKDDVSVRYGNEKVRQSGDIPRRYEAHPYNSSAYVSNVSVRPNEEKKPRHFLATVTYETPTSSSTPSSTSPNDDPLDQPPDIAWDSVRRRVTIIQDKDGNPIVNSAGDRFAEAIEEERAFPRVTIERNESEFDAAIAQDYKDSVNSDSLDIAGLSVSPWQATLKDLTGRYRQQDDSVYYRVRYVIEFKPGDGWVQNPLDQGYRAYDGAGNKGRVVEATESDAYKVGLQNGTAVDEPVRLDGTGGILGKTAAASSTVFLTYYTRYEREFWRLNLPRTMP